MTLATMFFSVGVGAAVTGTPLTLFNAIRKDWFAVAVMGAYTTVGYLCIALGLALS